MAITALSLEKFNDPALREEDLLARLAWLRDVIGPRLERYLGYYRNPISDLSLAYPYPANTRFAVRPYRQFQEIGLPARITGFRRALDGGCTPNGPKEALRKEIVIENDIAWRIDALVDFAASRMPAVTSTARDPETRARLTRVIGDLLENSAGACGQDGGLCLLQELVLQGAINGSAWVQIRPSEALLAVLGGGAVGAVGGESGMGRWLALEVLSPRGVCPVPHGDCADSAGNRPAYVALLRESEAQAAMAVNGSLLERVRAWFGRMADLSAQPEQFSFDIFGADHWQRYQRGVLVEEGENPLGVLPFVRYENAGDPAAGTRVGQAGSAAVDVGTGDVEPLIGMQDELNTRLCDRAYRVTMSSFRMFLGKGIEDFIKRPIGPGQMWGTDNLDASIEAFGGDQATPGEEAHIEEVREALDKISGVSPVAAGVIRGKLGNLTSAIALRLTLIALLARTQRKRAALTQTLAAVVRLGLEILDRAGLVRSMPEERGIDVNWPTALPESDMDRLNEAQAKVALGVPRDVVLTELGYGEAVQAAAQGAGAEQAGDQPAEIAAGGDVTTNA